MCEECVPQIGSSLLCGGCCLVCFATIQQWLFGKQLGTQNYSGRQRGCCNCSCCSIDDDEDDEKEEPKDRKSGTRSNNPGFKTGHHQQKMQGQPVVKDQPRSISGMKVETHA
ncbi:hypothetical protein FRB91_002356 [Serendipita sp. 411]|nr:hypothetical protein FRC15_004791 [Serendipita sp. 397]KAG8855274.1 hypothetical protein FRB91_002356 [Serendipita sp. 411]